jgi:hypothetical protein
LIVSGALDAWRFRDRSVSTFDRFWQTLVANAADAALPSITMSVTPMVVSPGDHVVLRALVRDVALSTTRPIRMSANAAIVSASGTSSVRLWAGDRIGSVRSDVRAPATRGVYRLTVSANGARAERPIVVAGDIARPSPEAPELLRAWVESRGGGAILAADVGSLAPRLVSAIHPADRRMTWHPMRSVWWILLFALALSAEWWLRRRRGLL